MNRQLFEYHPVIGYKFRHSLKARIPHEAGGYLVRTNKQGFRSEFDFSNEKQVGRPRILFFGDSFTAGDGVSNKFRFTDIVQEATGYECYNFGLPGSGTDQQFLLYREYGREIKADLVILMVLVENIRRVKSHFRYFYDLHGNKLVYQKPYFALEGSQLTLRNVPVLEKPLEFESLPKEEQEKVDTGGRFETARSLVGALGLKDITQKLTHYQPVPEYNSPASSDWLVLRQIISDWTSMIDSTSLVVPLPLYQFVEGTSNPAAYQARFKELSDSGVKVLDPLPQLLTHTSEERRNFRFKKDVHLTPDGHKAVASCLIPAIKSLISQ